MEDGVIGIKVIGRSGERGGVNRSVFTLGKVRLIFFVAVGLKFVVLVYDTVYKIF